MYPTTDYADALDGKSGDRAGALPPSRLTPTSPAAVQEQSGGRRRRWKQPRSTICPAQKAAGQFDGQPLTTGYGTLLDVYGGRAVRLTQPRTTPSVLPNDTNRAE